MMAEVIASTHCTLPGWVDLIFHLWWTCVCWAVPREAAANPRLMTTDQPLASRGIQAIKEDPDMLDSELSVGSSACLLIYFTYLWLVCC